MPRNALTADHKTSSRGHSPSRPPARARRYRAPGDSEKPVAWYALDAASKGVLHLLLSNRSLAFLKLDDPAAAVDDAEHCCLAAPGFAKGHLRLLAAMQAHGTSVADRRRACIRGLRACPSNRDLIEAMQELDAEVRAGGAGEGLGVAAAEEEAEASPACLAATMQATRRIANDPKDPRRALAACLVLKQGKRERSLPQWCPP